MKILFVAMMLVLSALAQAGDQQAASEPLSANSGEPLRWSEMSEEEHDAEPLNANGYPLRRIEMSAKEHDDWLNKKQKKIYEENERRQQLYEQKEDENKRQQLLDHAEDLMSPQCVAALEADIKEYPDEYPGGGHSGLTRTEYPKFIAQSRQRVKLKCINDIKEAHKEAERIKEREATKPKCTNIRFTGIATPPPYAPVIAQVLASRDIEDTLSRNPIKCKTNQFGNYVCTGVGYFRNHKGVIADWNREFFIINTPIDFNTGRENIGLTIRRKDAVCAK